MKGHGDVDDALTGTGAARRQRVALPTAVAFAYITTARARHDDDNYPKQGRRAPA